MTKKSIVLYMEINIVMVSTITNKTCSNNHEKHKVIGNLFKLFAFFHCCRHYPMYGPFKTRHKVVQEFLNILILFIYLFFYMPSLKYSSRDLPAFGLLTDDDKLHYKVGNMLRNIVILLNNL